MPKKRFNLRNLNPFKDDSTGNDEVTLTVVKDTVTVINKPEAIEAEADKSDSAVVKNAVRPKRVVQQTTEKEPLSEGTNPSSSGIKLLDAVPYAESPKKEFTISYGFVELLKKQESQKYLPDVPPHFELRRPKSVETSSAITLNDKADVVKDKIQESAYVSQGTEMHSKNKEFHFFNVEGLKNVQLPKGYEYKETILSDPSASVKLESINQRINNKEKGWMLWYIVGLVIIFGWLRLIYKRFFNIFLTSSINGQVSNRLFREKNAVTQRIALFLNILAFSTIGLFVFQLLNFHGVKFPKGFNNLQIALLLSIGISLFYFLKSVSISMISFMSDKVKLGAEYNHNTFVYLKSLGVFMLPVVVLIPFFKSDFLKEEYLITLGVALVGVFYLARLVRGALVCLYSKISILYLFLYLCVLELTPLAILIKAGILLSSMS